MASLRLFASIREEAGTREASFEAATVGELIGLANERFGDHFAELVGTCRVWVNGQPADTETAISSGDEVALLPPVSGG